jgi:hypothetical protein
MQELLANVQGGKQLLTRLATLTPAGVPKNRMAVLTGTQDLNAETH